MPFLVAAFGHRNFLAEVGDSVLLKIGLHRCALVSTLDVVFRRGKILHPYHPSNCLLDSVVDDFRVINGTDATRMRKVCPSLRVIFLWISESDRSNTVLATVHSSPTVEHEIFWGVAKSTDNPVLACPVFEFYGY